MLSHLCRLRYNAAVFVLTLVLAGCGTHTPRKRTIKPLTTANANGIFSSWTQSYLENKEEIARKKALKKRMREELPTLNVKQMDYDQLVIARKYFDELGYHDRAVKCYERMLALTKDSLQLNGLRLELADRFFDAGDFEKAAKLYVGFLEFYPGSDKREYVEYKAILSHFYLTLTNDRDQAETKTTLALTQDFLTHASIYKTYTQDVRDIQRQCYEKLTDSEMRICAFHLRHGNPKGAEQRLAYINKHYRRHAPALEHEILALETNVNSKLGLPVPEIPDLLQEDSVILAENTASDAHKKSRINRF